MPALPPGGILPIKGNPLCTRVYMTPGESYTAGQLLVQVGDGPSVALMTPATLAVTPTAVFVSPGVVEGHASKSLDVAVYRTDNPQIIWAAQIVSTALTATDVQALTNSVCDLIPAPTGQALLDTSVSTNGHCRLIELNADYLGNQGTPAVWQTGTAQWIVNFKFTPTVTKN